MHQVKVAGLRLLQRVTGILGKVSSYETEGGPLALACCSCLALHWKPTRDDGRILEALGAEPVLRGASGIAEKAHAIHALRYTADAFVTAAGTTAGTRTDSYQLLDHSVLHVKDVSAQLAAIADAVRSADMSVRELATLLITMSLSSRDYISVLPEADRTGLPVLHPELCVQ